MIGRFFETLRTMNKDLNHLPDVDYREDPSFKKSSEYLEVQRKKAIAQLGDKWLLKGGTYNRTNVLLGQK